jgi:hypothetical protein
VGAVELVEAEVPRSGNVPTGRYRRTVQGFLAGGRDSVRVEAAGSSPDTLYFGLYKTLRSLREHRVTVVRRGQDVFLSRTDVP